MPTERYVSNDDVRQVLATIYRADQETNLSASFARALSDPLRPIDLKGRWKPNPAWILLVVVFCALVGIFLYFSLGGRQ